MTREASRELGSDADRVPTQRQTGQPGSEAPDPADPSGPADQADPADPSDPPSDPADPIGPADGSTEGEGSTRRDRQRHLTRGEIMAAARELLSPHHSGQLSLRAVARAVGIAPSGLYRYFASREALVEALAHDARESAQGAMRAALAEALLDAGQGTAGAGDDHLHQALMLAHAYRRWCVEHPAEFSLLFAVQPTGPASTMDARGAVHPFFAGPLQHYVIGIRIGAVDPADAVLPVAPDLSPEAEAMRAVLTPELSPRDVGVLLWAWAALQGFVSLELLGPLGSFYADPEAAFDAHARAVFTTIGFRVGS